MRVFALLAPAAIIARTLALVPFSPTKCAFFNPRHRTSKLTRVSTRRESAEVATTGPVLLRDDVALVSSLSEVEALNAQYGRDVRVEEVNGTFVLVRGATAAHIGTLAGELPSMLQAAASSSTAEGPDVLCGRWGKCVKDRCVTIKKCGKACHFCRFHCHGAGAGEGKSRRGEKGVRGRWCAARWACLTAEAEAEKHRATGVCEPR